MSDEKPATEITETPSDTATDTAVPDTIRGRSVFAVEMTSAGLSVRTAFLSEQNQIIEMPAMFPDVHYALAQIDELRRLVMERFAQAAQIGAQVMAAQAAEQSQKAAQEAHE